MTADDVIKTLGLVPLPGEGGYFRETYRSTERLPGSNRSYSTAIYYMVTPETFSALHRLPHDEIFHFYLGAPVEMLIIHPDGAHEIVTLGADLARGQRPQFTVPAGCWQGTKLAPGENTFALLGTTVAPGFEFPDMEIKSRAELNRMFPDKSELIKRYTHE